MLQDKVSYKEIETKQLADLLEKGFDIHKQRAAEIFKVKPEKVTEEMRRVAKLINYYTLYGG